MIRIEVIVLQQYLPFTVLKPLKVSLIAILILKLQLRDNGHTNETDALVQYAIAHKVHVVEVDNHNHRRDLVDHNGYITKGYYDQTLFGKR